MNSLIFKELLYKYCVDFCSCFKMFPTNVHNAGFYLQIRCILYVTFCTLSIIYCTLSIIWWTPSHPNEKSMNNSAIEWDIEKTISQHLLNSKSLILGLLKTRDIANLSEKGIHHMMYPIHHMMYPVHHMMDPPIHHMMDGVHHMMDGVHHMMDLHYIIYCYIYRRRICLLFRKFVFIQFISINLHTGWAGSK